MKYMQYDYPSKYRTILRSMKCLFSVSACLLIGSSLSLNGQDEFADNDDIYELEAFEITGGFSGSLAVAAEQKKIQPVIVEMIVAEDIGKLPDTSIAESLARLPGLTTQRINSRAQGIVIRGLTGDFSTALLNGRQQVSTSGDRSVEFDQYPAELLNGVAVYKTSTASLVGQGLAGTINMQTIRPLSLDKKMFAINASYQMVDLGKLNPDSEDSGYRYTINYADQFLDKTLGVAFGYAYTDQAGQGEQFEAWGYPTVGDDEDYVVGGIKPFIRSSQFKRSSVMGVVEYRPSRSFHATLDLFVSNFEETQLLRGAEVPFQWSSAELQPGYTVSDGLVTNGVFNNVFMVMRNDETWRDADVINSGLNLRFGDVEGWVLEVDLNRSYMERKDNVLETWSGYGSNQTGTPDSVAFSMTGIGIQLDPTHDYNNANLMTLGSPQGWGNDNVPGGQVGFFKGPEAQDELLQYKAMVYREFDHPILRKFEAGVAYTDRNKWEIDAGPDGWEGWFLAIPDGEVTAPMPTSIGVTDLSFIGIDGQYSYDARALWESGYYDTVVNEDVNLLANNYDVTEKVTTLYAQADFEKELGERLLVGNIGFQAIHSEQSSRGFAATGSSVIPVVGEHDYWDIVPSLNLIFNLTENQKIRFTVARQIARQEMVDFRADSNYNFNETLATSTDPQESPWSGGGGNPELEPWRSNSLDLTYEHYFADGAGYWALNGFYKDLVSYTYSESTLSDFTGFDTNSDFVPAIYQGYRTIPVNGDGGKIQGLEATLSIPGEKITDMLTGFGVIISGSYTDSDIETSPGNSQPIPGLSEKVINATLYYERGGFAARVSSRYRSDYRGDISTFGPRGESYRTLNDETIIDAQIGYTFQEGSSFEGLSITLQGSNLTDEPLFGYDNGDSRLIRNYQAWGAEYTVGVSYKF